MPAFTWYSGITSTFAELTTAERVNGAKQTRMNESAMRSISAIPDFRSWEWKPLTPVRIVPSLVQTRLKRAIWSPAASATVLSPKGLQRRGNHRRQVFWAWGGFILAEN